MGFFGAIKEILKFNKELKKSIQEEKERTERYLVLSHVELSALPDDELLDAAILRTEGTVEKHDEWADGVNALNHSQKVLYSLVWLGMEVNNGGLCQFFVNSSRMVAPCVSEYMELVGAYEHKKLYDGFVQKYGIDLCDLSFFDVEKAEEYEKKANSYPFDEYDDAFDGLEPLGTYLKKFVREHLEDF